MGEKNGNSMSAVGIPRALLYYRRGAVWEQFFRLLDIPTILSPPGSRGILEAGTRLAPDESCLALKMFIGHVDTLIGRCGQILFPDTATMDIPIFSAPAMKGFMIRCGTSSAPPVSALSPAISTRRTVPGVHSLRTGRHRAGSARAPGPPGLAGSIQHTGAASKGT